MEGRLSLCEAAASHGLSRQSAGKWVRCYRESGVSGLRDRSSRPVRLRQPTCPSRLHVWKLFVANAGRAYGSRKPLA